MRRLVIAVIAGLLAPWVTPAWGQPFDDTLVQAPSLGQPQRGSIAGTLSKAAFGPSDLVRGSFRLGLSIEVPEERGPLLAAIFPSYSTEAGLSEWGMGWSSDLAIRRHRDAGDLDYQSDGYTSPWGRLEQGADGAHYPRGLKAVVKATLGTAGWEVRTPEGTVYLFEHPVTTPRGTYAWMLSEVVTVLGDRTTITWANNATGNAFIERVLWGGRGAGDAYEAEFLYETLAMPRESYAAGARMELDRRVSEVIIRARSAGRYVERWRYVLGYTASPLGPAFYLTAVGKHYPSGEAEPTTSYEYDMGVEQLAVAPLVSVPGLEPLIRERGGEVLNPDHGAIFDLEDNGLLDFEDGYDQLTWRQTAPGQFVTEALPPPTGDEHPLCRSDPSALNSPRRLVRMHPAAAEPQVVGTEYTFGLEVTNVVACDRTGMVLFNLPLLEDWRLGPRTRLTDVNGDLRPDLVRVSRDRVEVLPNASEGAGALAFGVMRTTMLSPEVTSDAVWLLDANGDGKADLVKRISQGLLVWPGKGQGELESEARLIEVEENGHVLTGLNRLHFSFGDYNNDGLIDAVLSASQEPHLFINRGDRLVSHPVPAFATVPLDIDGLIVADVTGSGEEEIVFTTLETAFAVRLTSPSTGLMRQADDGKGTRLTFDYRRAEPTNGVGRRQAVLDQVTVETAGYDAVTSVYDYAAPTIHSLGRYLVGFGEVTRLAPLTTETATFANDDDVAGLMLTSEVFDERTPGLARVQRHSYEEAGFKGIRWLRNTSSDSGWREDDGQELVTTQRVLEYTREICPTRVEEQLPAATLRREVGLASVVQLDDDLHCLAGNQRLIGEHTDSRRNFDYTVRLTHNDRGQVTKVEELGGGETLTLQEVDYDPTTHRITSVSAPGRGVQTFAYNPVTGQLDRTTAADGVAAAVQNRDPRTDALLELVGDHGPGGVLVSSFRYDGMERLATRWADFGGSSAAKPLETIGYQFPTADVPGLIQVSSLIDAATTIRQESASWFYPDGEELASASRIPGQWMFGAVSTMSRAELRTRRDRRAPLLDSADLAAQTYGALRVETTQLGENLMAGFGHKVSQRTVIQQGVERRIETSLSLTDGLLVTSSVENGQFETRSAADASGRAVWVSDQNGKMTRYEYDALGRLVAVTLADGTRQQLFFDGLGRPAQVIRDGIGTITYTYEPVTGRLDHKDYRDREGTLERTCEYEYDAIGRVIEQAHVQPLSGEETYFTFRYDGDIGGGEILPGQRGYKTQVEGPAYTSTTVHYADGREARTSIVFSGWMQVDVSSTYYAGGELKETHRVIKRLSDGAVIEDVTTGYLVDASGRPERVTVNGEAVATAHYDSEGRVAWVELAGDQRIDNSYDPATHRRLGYSQRIARGGGTWQTGVEWTFNDRGFIESEALDLGDQSWLRSYRYDPRGFLSRSEDADQLSTYTYTDSGLPNQVTDESGTRTVFRGNASTLDVGGIRYTWDKSGRLIARGEATFTYGPDGQLYQADIGDRAVSYAYDADGNRLLKFENGVPVAAFVGGGYLTNDSFVAPVKGAGRLVGVLDGGEFQLLGTDPRGTVLADRDGTPRLATPYGVREARPDLSAALDYVEKGYDADLATVRMGVRDYDPLLGQFWTPDPLYLEAIETCAKSPVQCNLFSYALNDPLRFIDPDGQGVWQALGSLGKVAMGLGIAVGGCVGGMGVGCLASIAGGFSIGEQGLRELMTGEPQKPIVERMGGPRAQQMFNWAIVAASVYAAAESAIVSYLSSTGGAAAGPQLTITKSLGDEAAEGLDAAIAEGTAAARGATVGICFAAGTLVHTERGLTRIEDVQVGNRVWSRSEETGEESYRRVVRTFVTPDQPTLELQFVRDGGATDSVEATVEHPFWVVDRGWVAARDLRPGDDVYTSQGGWVRVSSGTWTERTTTVYNFEVEEFHTYFVGELGLWVHNNSSLTRPMTPADLGLSRANLSSLKGTIWNAGSTRILQVEDIAGEFRRVSFAALCRTIVNQARSDGIQTLQIAGRFANERVQTLVARLAAELGGSVSCLVAST